MLDYLILLLVGVDGLWEGDGGSFLSAPSDSASAVSPTGVKCCETTHRFPSIGRSRHFFLASVGTALVGCSASYLIGTAVRALSSIAS